jgi:CheY-like chemotaxis protein
LVDTSRIAAGKLVLDRKTSDLAAIVRAGVESAMPVAQKNNVTVTLNLIVSDLGLPEVDGFDLIASIRDAERTTGAATTPAAAFTAFASQSIRRKALEGGFQLCLTKPIQPLALVQAIPELRAAHAMPNSLES